MRQKRVIYYTLIVIATASCGVPRLISIISESLSGETKDVKSVEIKKSDTDIKSDPGLKKVEQATVEAAKTPDDGTKLAQAQQKQPRASSEDFYKVDENGVIIYKRDGIQTTVMPDGEELILPDEF